MHFIDLKLTPAQHSHRAPDGKYQNSIQHQKYLLYIQRTEISVEISQLNQGGLY